MSRIVVYKLKVFSSFADDAVPYFEFETDNELYLIREMVRALADQQHFLARFVVTKTES